MRIDKALSDLGISRKDAKYLVKCGEVSVNGELVNNVSEQFDADSGQLTIRGENVEYKRFFYLMMNKPEGYLSATEDLNCATVIDLLEDDLQKVGLFPVGRLDKDTSGLLILTNDGYFAYKVTSPGKNILKEYRAKVRNPIPEFASALFKEGITLKDGTKCKCAYLDTVTSGAESEVIVKISEGKYHQVKRMLAELGNPVIRLRRIKIGNLCLDDKLEPGAYRELTGEEINLIFR